MTCCRGCSQPGRARVLLCSTPADVRYPGGAGHVLAATSWSHLAGTVTAAFAVLVLLGARLRAQVVEPQALRLLSCRCRDGSGA